MRILTINLLGTAALLLGASVASAVSFDLTSNYDGVSVLGISDTVTVQIFLDTEGQFDLQVLDIGLLFDDGIFQYAGGSMASYLLYAPPGVVGRPPAPVSWIEPLPQYRDSWDLANCPDFAFTNCLASPTLFPGTISGLVNTGYVEAYDHGTRATGFDILFATMVFHVLSVGDGLGEIDLAMTTANRVQLIDGTILDSQIGFSGSFAVVTPEPGTAILLALGLAGLIAFKRV